MRFALMAFIVTFFVAPFAIAQDEVPTKVGDQNRTGDIPFSAAVAGVVDRVDFSSGNLLIEIPIASVPGRGMDYNFSLRYDARFLLAVSRVGGSQPFDLWTIERRPYLLDNAVGWTPNQPFVTWIVGSKQCPGFVGTPGGTVPTTSSYIFTDASGSKHPLALSSEGGECTGGSNPGSYFIGNNSEPDTSGAGIWAFANSMLQSGPAGLKIYLRDGTKLTPGGLTPPDNVALGERSLSFGTYADTNGNTKSEYAGGLDTVGRTIVSQQTGTNQIIYIVRDSSGTAQLYTVNFQNLTINTNFNSTGPNGFISEITNVIRKVVSSIQLPNGRQYAFQYDSYGAITRMDLPAGGWIGYTWGTHRVVPGSTAISSIYRYVTNRVVHVGATTYSWTINIPDSSYTVTVTNPDGRQSVYDVEPHVGAVATARIYDGVATGNPARRYDLAYYQVPGQSDILGFPTSITTTLDSGLVSSTEIDYDSFGYTYLKCVVMLDCFSTGTGIPVPGTASRGNITEMRSYDWGQGSHGLLVKRINKEYLHNDDSTYLNNRIVDRVSRLFVRDQPKPAPPQADVSPKARTDYTYDEGSVANPKPGNATTVSQWSDIANSAKLNSHYAYNGFGNITSITDPGGHSTSWTYGSISPCNGVNLSTAQLYPTVVTNAKNQQVQLDYYPCTGRVWKKWDVNGNLTTFVYDLFGREVSRTLPANGLITNCYSDVSPSSCSDPNPKLTITTTTKITSAQNLIQKTLQDEIGRAIQTQLVSDPLGTVFTDTTYDFENRALCVSNPYRGATTDGQTCKQYDALGRVNLLIPQDGTPTTNNVKTEYQGNCATVTDEAGHARRTCTDALGRLTRVEEPGVAQ